MIIRHNLPTRRFTRLDRAVFTNKELSDGAVRLYAYLCSLRNGANFSDTYIMVALGLSRRALGNRKKELKEHKLLLTEQIGSRVYVAYIGYSRMTAEEVKDNWGEDEDIFIGDDS